MAAGEEAPESGSKNTADESPSVCANVLKRHISLPSPTVNNLKTNAAFINFSTKTFSPFLTYF